MYLVFSREIRDIPFLEGFLDSKVCLYNEKFEIKNIKAVIGWGLKDTAKKARIFAFKNNLPYISLEDGFVCSYKLRSKGAKPLSLVIDPIGIYYNSNEPSLLETLVLNSKEWMNEIISKRTEEAKELIIKHNITKFNYAPEATERIFKGKRNEKVLLVDQTKGDLSVIYGMGDESTFLNMYNNAIRDNPESDIYVKIHPDVIAKQKKGYLSEIIRNNHRVFIISEDVNSISLLKFFDKVYTVSSQMGFEALLLGKKVYCYGMPFYAGWGLTEDTLQCPRRNNQQISLKELFAASYLKYCQYINPKTGEKGTLFDVISYIIKQKEINYKISTYDYYCIDFHLIKKRHIKQFLKTEKNKNFFIKSSTLKKLSLNGNSAVVVWGNKKRKEISGFIQKNMKIFTIEDGFIRSVGLGSDLIPPMSIVIDRTGIYYNTEQESDLEDILNNHVFTKSEIDEANKIIKLIIQYNITKYNVDILKPLKISSSNKKIILVPGQVEEDESIIFGGYNIKNNFQLLSAIRERNPEAFIMYKPHPDVLSKNRRAEYKFEEMRRLCDYIETEANILSCIEIADEVHTITSLSGFDALIRQKKVVTYGAPFYAGWGLTEDHIEVPRRRRKLTLNELVAGALIIYPIYYDRILQGYCDCETLIYRIAQERNKKNFISKTFMPMWVKKLSVWMKSLKQMTTL